MPVDARGKLAQEPFTWKVNPGGALRIYWEGKLVKVVPPAKAHPLTRKLEAAGLQDAQLLLAKATGNFKRGNEREAKAKQARP